MRAYQTLVITLGRSMLREPVGLFFTLIFPPLLVAILGTIFGNDPTPQFDGKGFVDATLPALPSGVRHATQFSPLRHLVELMQGLWAGHAWSDYGVATAVLLGMIVIFGALGARLFKWG